MAGRYSAEFLLHLRQSPLCVKPPALPPADEWMGPPPEAFRNQPKPSSDRKSATGEGLLLNQENRRPALDRNGSRSAANPDEIILGPPRPNFASATSARTNRVGGEPEKALKDPERQDRSDRFNFRTRANDSEPATNDRFREGRDGRNNTFRRRGDQDQDSEGWSTVKPRKSFGAEGAERFHGRMGAAGERFTTRDDRRARDRDDREVNDRRARNPADPNARDTEAEELEGPRNRNSLARAKPEPWSRDNPNNGATSEAPVSQRERIDKAKSWRDRDPNANDNRHSDRTNERTNERTNDRNYDRRWDRERDQRVERDPEWLDEPLEEKSHGHTEEDFKKFMESMKAKQGGAPKPEGKAPMVLDRPNTENLLEPEQKVASASAPAIESGPDKFFVAFGGGSLDATTPTASAAAAAAENKEAARSKNKKSSRFMTFLTTQEDTRARTEPPIPAAIVQHSGPSNDLPPQGETEKEAFAMLIQKLQRSRMEPGMQGNAPPQQLLARLMEQSPAQDHRPNSAVASPEPLQGYGGDHREDPRFRGQHDDLRLRQQLPHTMVSPRPVAPPVQPPPAMRPEQVLQDLLAQRHSFANQANPRVVQNNPPINSNTEFLMKLMQNHRADVSESLPRMEPLPVRMPQPTKQVSLANIPDRDLDYQRERTILQRHQQMRGQQGPPGFLEDQFHPSEVDSRPQPTQILQRPPPPGLDHHGIHQFQMGGPGAGGGQLPPPQRPMIPPPGLVNGPRNVPLPGMYPNFPPPPVFPPEGVMGVPPPGPPNQQQRGMQPPPGFFGGLPPPGFMQQPPPGMGGGFQVQGGLDGPGGFPGAVPPYDRRGMMPPGYRGP